jgi:hypothetical protein
MRTASSLALRLTTIAVAALLAAVMGTRPGAQAPARLMLEFEDYAQLPLTGELDGDGFCAGRG